MVVTKYFRLIVFLAAIPVVVSSCKKAGGDYPGDQYTFDMISSRAYETYSLNPELRDSMSAIPPVAGTVPYVGNAISGKAGDSLKMSMNLPYAIPNTIEGYEKAGTDVKNPLNPTDKKVLDDGKHFFMIYCSVCHGSAGDGKGFIVTEGKYTAAPPSYFDPTILALAEGKMFHSITYGKGAMQSYAYALTKEERWKVISYIKQLQADHVKNAMPADTMSATTSKIK
ncbi:MAG: c-type cytochrome [Chitinophagales bacterium]